jgi:hypothetical protein
VDGRAMTFGKNSREKYWHVLARLTFSKLEEQEPYGVHSKKSQNILYLDKFILLMLLLGAGCIIENKNLFFIQKLRKSVSTYHDVGVSQKSLQKIIFVVLSDKLSIIITTTLGRGKFLGYAINEWLPNSDHATLSIFSKTDISNND